MDVEGGFEADGGRGFGVGEESFEGRVGQVDEGLGAFAVEKSAVVLGVREGELEIDAVAAPVVDGVAMDAGFGGGFGDGDAVREGVDYRDLSSGKSVIGHRIHFLIRA